MNTVNKDNFNQTMDGYVKRAWDEAEKTLDDSINKEELEEIRRAFFRGLHYSKDLMSMEEARNYKG